MILKFNHPVWTNLHILLKGIQRSSFCATRLPVYSLFLHTFHLHLNSKPFLQWSGQNDSIKFIKQFTNNNEFTYYWMCSSGVCWSKTHPQTSRRISPWLSFRTREWIVNSPWYPSLVCLHLRSNQQQQFASGHWIKSVHQPDYLHRPWWHGGWSVHSYIAIILCLLSIFSYSKPLRRGQ